MLSGGCTGSTSGGIKNMRLLIVARAIRNEFKHLLHPNAVLPVRINKQTVSSSIVTTVLIFFAFYLVLIPIGWTALLFLGVGFSGVRQYGYFEYRQCRSGIGNLRYYIFVEFFTRSGKVDTFFSDAGGTSGIV